MPPSSSKPWPTFCCSYLYKGKTWSLNIVAEDWDDARNRLESISAFGTVDGILKATIPASIPATGLYVRFFVWWRNLLSRLTPSH